ncbi:MAG: translation elongation factor Ts [Metamycoplasmataceae bacterium]
MSAQLIKELRERTGSGFVDCKKALEASNNDIDKAIIWLQENGIAKAVKKAGRIAAEGLVKTIVDKNSAIIYEVNSETDFVAKNKQFIDVVEKIGNILLSSHFSNNNDSEILNLKSSDGKTIEEITLEATSVIGEKISFRRAIKIKREEGFSFGAYTHSDGQKAALFVAKGSNDENLKGIAMHITAMSPEFLNESSVPSIKIEEIKKQVKDELAEVSGFSTKPEQIQKNIFDGKVAKILSEFTLLEQEYVVENGKKVNQFLKEIGAKELEMYRFEVGEGIEKNHVDFATEVKSQMKK